MSSTNVSGTQRSRRRERIVASLTEVLAKLFGRKPSELDTCASMIDLGGDSLFLLQASNAIKEKFSVKIPFRLLLEELSTIDSLATHLDQKMPPESIVALPSGQSKNSSGHAAFSEPVAAPRSLLSQQEAAMKIPQLVLAQQAAALGPVKTGHSENDAVLQIFAQQLALMSQQIAILTGQSEVQSPSLPVQATAGLPQNPFVEEGSSLSTGSGAAQPTRASDKPTAEVEPEVYIPYEAIQVEGAKSLSERQRKHLAELIERINKRTRESKHIIQRYRRPHADNRTAAGFRMPWKEMFYPLVVERGQGSHIWDVDGNEYIDMTMGFGALLFGHSPSFILDTLRRQLDSGLRLGPHSREAGEAAQLICEMTGVERVAFCNSGTEAVMTALRLARTVTGRSRIALFEGCYHGTFDGILVKGQRRPDGSIQTTPLAPGIPEHMIDNVLMLKYDDPQSLEILRACAGELAAVLIEPPRSRRPDVQPRDFLLALRTITQDFGAALIFDEVVTGFRFHPGGAQAVFGIRSDLVIYGKAMAGGLPVAAVAGKSRFMDAIDGGMWQYGDSSYPEEEITFFTGTYFKHPMLMPAVVAALKHVRDSGANLQESLNAKAKYASDELGAFFAANRFPLRMAQLGSLLRILHGPSLRYMDLFFYHLLEKGIYVCETHNCFVSTAHTDADMHAFVRACQESLLELRDGGFLPEASTPQVAVGATDASTRLTDHNGEIRVPLTEAQRQIWAVCHMGESDARAYNLPLVIRWCGNLDVPLLRKTINLVVERHEAFRATFSADGDFQLIAPRTLEIPMVDLSGAESAERQERVEYWRRSEATQSFDFAKGPLLSLHLLKLEPGIHLLLVTLHHIVGDGWSLGLFLNELLELYVAHGSGRAPQLPPVKSFAEYARTKAAAESRLSGSEAEAFWTNEFPNSIPLQRLPADGPSPEDPGIAGAQTRITMPVGAVESLKEIGKKYSSTYFMVMLAVCKIFIYYLTKQEEVVIGVPTAGQNLSDGGYVAGCCVNLLALQTQMSMDLSFPQLVVLLRQKLVKAYEYADYPFNRLLQRLRVLHRDHPEPAVSVIFNLDRAQTAKNQQGFVVEVLPSHNRTSKFDLTLDITDSPEALIVDFEYKSGLFSSRRIASWMELFRVLLERISQSSSGTVREYLALLQEEEARENALTTQELKRQEQQRFAASKRKTIVT